jgi:teichuronic acid biosynthesis glycosyltransferase TuaH
MLDATVLADLPGTHEGAEHDVVFTFSYVSWQAAARRGWFMSEDRLARALVTHRRVRRVLVCDVMRSLPIRLARDLLTPAPEHARFPAGERARLLRPVRLRRGDPTSLGGAQRMASAYDAALRRAAQRMGLRDPVVITAHPLIAGLAELSWARASTFYAIDDWSAYPLRRRWWPAYRQSFAAMRVRRRRVAAVSDTLLARLAPTGESSVIPNGLEPTEWIGDPTPPGWVGDVVRPLLLYVGSLDARLDIPGLLAIARELPQARVLLVGALLDPEHLRPLRAARNIEVHPPLARDAVTGLIRVADVGLIPHVRSRLTEAMSPLKLYEYLAGGLPVVAADLPPVRCIDRRVLRVGSSEGYPEAVRAALAAGPAGEDERLTFVQTNSWAARHERLLDLAFA